MTGYMFGKGVYFADSVSKSANYCFTTAESNTGCMLLCEVALGESRELLQADYNAAKLPAGKLSTKGVGRQQPDPAESIRLDDGCIVPSGTLKEVPQKGGSLIYNEYIGMHAPLGFCFVLSYHVMSAMSCCSVPCSLTCSLHHHTRSALQYNELIGMGRCLVYVINCMNRESFEYFPH